MPKLTSKVSLYTRTNGKYELTDPRGIYPAEMTTFALRFVGDSGKRTYKNLPKGTSFADARKAALEKELALGDPALNTPSLRHEPQMPSAAVQAWGLTAAIDRHIDSLWKEGEHKDKTIRSKQTILREFATWAGKRSPEQCDRAALLEYKAWLMSKGQSERTANNKTVHVVAFLRSCGMREILTKKDWRAMKALQRRTTRKAYSKAEIAKMREVATVDERDALEFLLTTGMRKNQAVATKWTDVDFLNRVVSVPDGVGTTEIKKARAAKLGAELLARLEARKLRYPGATYVFETDNKTPDEHIDRLVTAAAERAGVSLAGKSVLHSLRKTFATRLLNDAGYDMYKVSRLLGHRSIQTTELYASFDADAETAGDDIEAILAAEDYRDRAKAVAAD